MSKLLLQRVNERWAKNGKSTGDLGEEVTFVEESWPLPAGEPLKVRFCTRKGHPMKSFCKAVETPKTSIVLHHTSGYGHFSGLMGSGGGGIHFMIGRDGNAYRMVDTEFVAWHATWWNNNSIGIEIDNIGALKEKKGNLLDEYGNVYCTTSDKDAWRELQFRSTKYWATWTESQYVCLGKLLRALGHKHGIPLRLLPEPQRYGAFRKPDDRARFRGICVHLNVEPQNRDDLGPYVDWGKIVAYAGLSVGDCLDGAPMPEVKRPAKKEPAPAKKAAAPAPAKPKRKPGEPLPPPTPVDAHTIKVHVGSRPGRIGLTVQQPGDPIATSPDAAGEAPPPQADGKRDEFLRHAMGFLGTAWKAGSDDPKEGLDGASLIGICLRRVGLLEDDEERPDGPALAMRYHVTGGDETRPPAEIVPGDLAFFGSGDHDQDAMQHPLIWLGGGRVLGPLPDHGSGNGSVKVVPIADVPDHFAGWSHLDDLGGKTEHTAHPGDAPAGTKISGALLPPHPAERYDYLKEVVGHLGGRWSDEKGKLNLVGVQEMHDLCLVSPRRGEWNDTLFASYLDADGHKCSLELRASLNPGFDPDPAGAWQLVDGSFAFKLDAGDAVGKALIPGGKVKGWLDEQGLGALRPGEATSKVVEGDFATVKVQIASGGTGAPERPTKSTQLVWGGDGASSPWGLLRALVEAGGGEVVYTYLHAGALLKARNAGAADAVKDPGPAKDEEKKEEEKDDAKAEPATGPLFEWGIDFEFDNKGKKDARVWAHPRAAHAGPRPLVIYLHGIRIPGEHPQLTEKISKDWCLHAGKLAAAMIDAGTVTPLAIAAPTCAKYGGSGELWTKFDLAGFVRRVAEEVKASGVEIDLDEVSVVGHSGAGCDGSNGLLAIARHGASFDGHALKVLGFADTCASAGLAAAAARGLKDNTTTAIYALHKGHGGGSQGDSPEAFAKGFGAKGKSTAFAGNENGTEIDDFRDNGGAAPARISAHLAEAGLFAHEDEFVKAGAMKSGWPHANGWARHYVVCLLWTWYALPRFHAASGAEKAEKKPEPARVTGGEWADVPVAPPFWTPPEGAEPKATGAAEFADPGSGIFWPVRGKTQHGRTVCFRSVDGRLIGYPKKGGGFHTENREFLAERSGTWEGKTEPRYHAAIDLFGDSHDLVVACESGTILNWHLFYHGVYKLFVQCDSGLVINYGEVDESSKSEFKLAPKKRIVAGQPIARIGRMTGGGHMLHFETYPKGTKDNQQYWRHDSPAQLAKFRNGALYLLALARAGR